MRKVCDSDRRMEHLRLQLPEARDKRQLKSERSVATYLAECTSDMREIGELLPLDSTRGNVDRGAGWKTKLNVTFDSADFAPSEHRVSHDSRTALYRSLIDYRCQLRFWALAHL